MATLEEAKNAKDAILWLPRTYAQGARHAAKVILRRKPIAVKSITTEQAHAAQRARHEEIRAAVKTIFPHSAIRQWSSLYRDIGRYFTSEPVMEIRKRGNGDFVVDFEAGFQRGRITVGQRELTTRARWPNPSPGYLKWIGLSYGDAEVRQWLRERFA